MNGNGGIIAVNTFGANGLLSRNNGGTVLYTFDPSGNAVEGSLTSGTVATTYTYMGYGFGAGRKLAGGKAVTLGPFTFGGQWGGYTDVETGLVLMTHCFPCPYFTACPNCNCGNLCTSICVPS